MAENSFFNPFQGNGSGNGVPPAQALPGRSTRATNALGRIVHTVIGSSRPNTSAGPSLSHPPITATSHSTDHARNLTHHLDLPAVALAISLAISPDRDHAVVAGRGVLKILHVSSNITAILNLRNAKWVSKTTIVPSDVQWGVNWTSQSIATAATNGMVCIYDLKKEGLYDKFHEHNRSVHKIAFNPTDGRLILSGSQDGTMKYWDLRQRRSRCTYTGRCEAVRDVQFNEVRPLEFAAAFDNGTIQLWDSRHPDTPIRRIHAHNGIVFSVDWHPDGKHIASGGRDKTVKVWNLYTDSLKKPKQKHTINTIASVQHVAWRPQGVKGTELATFAGNFDFRLQVWDLKRPFIATCVIDAHDKDTTGMLWRDENTLWSTSKDMTFMQHDINYAQQPINQLSHSAFGWNQKDDFTFAMQPRVRPKRSGTVRFDTEEDVGLGGPNDRRRQSRAPSFKSGRSHSSGLVSVLDLKMDIYKLEQTVMQIKLPIFDSEPFEYMAENYKVEVDSEETLAQVCEYNGAVAWEATKFRVAQSWRMLGLVAGWEEEYYAQQEAAKTTVPELAIVNKSLLGVKGYDGLVAQASTSNTTTPLARPVVEAPPTHLAVTHLTPTLSQPILSKLSHVDENLELPPAAFATSLSSSTASTDGGDLGQFSRRNSEQIFRNESPEDNRKTIQPSLSIATPSSAMNINRKANSSKPSPTDTVPDTEGVSESYGSMTLPMFSNFTEQSGNNLSSNSNSNSNSDEPVLVPAPDTVSVQPPANDANNSSSSYSQSFTHTRGRQYSFGLTSEQTSSSFGDEAPAASASENLAHMTSHIRALNAITEETGSVAPEMMSRVLSAHGHTQPTIHVQQPSNPRPPPSESPWNLQEMLNQLLEYHANQGDTQTSATLVLLFSRLPHLYFDKRRTDEYIESYTTLLRSYRLHIPAAFITKSTSSAMTRVKGQTGTHVALTCYYCYKSVERAGAAGNQTQGSWYCERCKRAMMGCVFCHRVVKGSWVMCQGCSHGGHDECLRSWFFGDGKEARMGVCPGVGCLCQCLPFGGEHGEELG